MGNNDIARRLKSVQLAGFPHFGETVKKVAALPPSFPPQPVRGGGGGGRAADVAAGFSDDLLSRIFQQAV